MLENVYPNPDVTMIDDISSELLVMISEEKKNSPPRGVEIRYRKISEKFPYKITMLMTIAVVCIIPHDSTRLR